ncbi:MAG: methyltransferase domain-containing protein [Candidatus Omnitrophica bacterium]|nr:methyltransferase domain-containing protein [Candidatus Omnitrophota bacterium]MBD3269233.1 methyltransferase domain-containing protein [Candidatus Omnitrophota bacterium]
MKILNLGCGTKTSDSKEVINIDWSMYLRIKKNKILKAVAPLFIKGERRERFHSLPDNIMVCNLLKRLPFDSGSVDVVYHSHMLEHLYKDVAAKFLLETKRVLRAGGIHRIVVPDLEKLCRDYLEHISECSINPEELDRHDYCISAFLEQSVRKEAVGTSQQKPFRRLIENIILGDARRRGETHQWMYDRINLKALLLNLGYRAVKKQKYNTSLITDWNSYGLDSDESGRQYKPGSLYIEAVK